MDNARVEGYHSVREKLLYAAENAKDSEGKLLFCKEHVFEYTFNDTAVAFPKSTEKDQVFVLINPVSIDTEREDRGVYRDEETCSVGVYFENLNIPDTEIRNYVIAFQRCLVQSFGIEPDPDIQGGLGYVKRGGRNYKVRVVSYIDSSLWQV